MSEPGYRRDPLGNPNPADYVVAYWSAYGASWRIFGTYTTLSAARGQRTKMPKSACAKIIRATGWEVIE